MISSQFSFRKVLIYNLALTGSTTFPFPSLAFYTLHFTLWGWRSSEQQVERFFSRGRGSRQQVWRLQRGFQSFPKASLGGERGPTQRPPLFWVGNPEGGGSPPGWQPGGTRKAVKAEEIERSLKSLNEKLTSALTESTAKDELLAKHIKVAEEALEGWEKAEAEAASLKEELDDALQCKFTAEEKIADIETALEECKQQLQVGHEEQKQMASDAAMKTLREKEKIRKFEERLVELNKCLSKLGSENSNLIKDLEIKEKLIEDLSERNNQAYAKINAVTENLESLEKDNASLKYEVCMLEKELQIRNEEREFNLKSVDAAHKQHLESVRKIAKLESECQRLRVMVRKRLPGPAALAKMRREVELLGKDTYEMKKKKPNSTTGLLVREFVVENYSDSSHRRDSLVEQLNVTEEENRILKETLTKKNSELQSARVMCAHTASKLSHAEKKLEEISKGHANFGGTKNSPASYDMPVVSACENGANEDNISCAESWASALISELENFRNVKTLTISPKSSVVSELNLMDDFIDMEKLAIVCVDKPLVNSSSLSGIKSTCLSPCDTTSKHDDSPEAINNSNVEIQSGSRSFEKSSRWLQDVVSAILQRYHVSKRSLDSILEEVRVTLASKGYSIGIHPCGVLHANGEHLRKTQHSSPNLLDAEYGANLFLGETATSQSKSMFDKSVKKLIKLIEEINKKLLTHDSILQAASKNDESTIPRRRLTYAGYISCVFHWKTTELTSNLQCLIQTCNDVLSQKTKGEIFFEHLISTMERIINHCFSLQGVSSMKDTFKKLDWYESHELAVGGNCQCQGRMFTLLEGKHTTETLSLSVTDNSGEEMGSNLHGESRSLSNDTMKLDHLKEMKVGQKSVSENDSLIEQLVESEKNILNLKAELATLKESKRIIEAQIEHQRLLNEELDTQLSAAKVELNGVHQKFSSLEEALGDKTNCCEELEATCLELQLQLERYSEIYYSLNY
ncbi:hypothetical protein Taro_008360 [Colocasia esculenta]|uniref:Filament-like plant protein 7 n=1 Tax=Colocasia esculenta TaxID=4460 RepID=A0A843U1M1_COLES|nr:hypothetical protein [Colocasia esculenta]